MFDFAVPHGRAFLLPDIFGKMRNQTKTQNAFTQESLQASDVYVMSDLVKYYCNTLSKFDVNHGVKIEHLFKTIQNSLSTITEMCDDKKSHNIICDQVHVLWTIIEILQENLPYELFNKIDDLIFQLSGQIKISAKCK